MLVMKSLSKSKCHVVFTTSYHSFMKKFPKFIHKFTIRSRKETFSLRKFKSVKYVRKFQDISQSLKLPKFIPIYQAHSHTLKEVSPSVRIRKISSRFHHLEHIYLDLYDLSSWKSAIAQRSYAFITMEGSFMNFLMRIFQNITNKDVNKKLLDSMGPRLMRSIAHTRTLKSIKLKGQGDMYMIAFMKILCHVLPSLQTQTTFQIDIGQIDSNIQETAFVDLFKQLLQKVSMLRLKAGRNNALTKTFFENKSTFECIQKLDLSIWMPGHQHFSFLKETQQLVNLSLLYLKIRFIKSEEIYSFLESFTLHAKVRDVRLRVESLKTSESIVSIPYDIIETFINKWNGLENLKVCGLEFYFPAYKSIFKNMLTGLTKILKNLSEFKFFTSLSHEEEINAIDPEDRPIDIKTYLRESSHLLGQLEKLQLKIDGLHIGDFSDEKVINMGNLKRLTLLSTISGSQNLWKFVKYLRLCTNTDYEEMIKPSKMARPELDIQIGNILIDDSETFKRYLKEVERLRNVTGMISFEISPLTEEEFAHDFIEFVSQLTRGLNLSLGFFGEKFSKIVLTRVMDSVMKSRKIPFVKVDTKDGSMGIRTTGAVFMSGSFVDDLDPPMLFQELENEAQPQPVQPEQQE